MLCSCNLIILSHISPTPFETLDLASAWQDNRFGRVGNRKEDTHLSQIASLMPCFGRTFQNFACWEASSENVLSQDGGILSPDSPILLFRQGTHLGRSCVSVPVWGLTGTLERHYFSSPPRQLQSSGLASLVTGLRLDFYS